MAAGETRFSNAAKSRWISVRRLAVDELGLEPWDQLETALSENPVMRVNASRETAYRFAKSFTEKAPPLLETSRKIVRSRSDKALADLVCDGSIIFFMPKTYHDPARLQAQIRALLPIFS
jgi:hypothetical protein